MHFCTIYITLKQYIYTVIIHAHGSRGGRVFTAVCLCVCSFRTISLQELSCRRLKASQRCKIIRYMQHCYDTVRFIIYNTDSKSSGYYSTVQSTFKSSVTTKTQPMSQSIRFWKQEAQLLPRDHAMRNVNPNPIRHNMITMPQIAHNWYVTTIAIMSRAQKQA